MEKNAGAYIIVNWSNKRNENLNWKNKQNLFLTKFQENILPNDARNAVNNCNKKKLKVNRFSRIKKKVLRFLVREITRIENPTKGYRDCIKH